METDLRAFIYSVVRDWVQVDDVLQEVAMVLWRRYADYDPRYTFGAWARGVARGVLSNERRRRRPEVMDPTIIAVLADANQVVVAEAAWDHEDAALQACIAELDARARRMLDLRYVGSLGWQAIAEELKRSPGAIKKALQRIRDRLRQCIAARLAPKGVGQHDA